MGQAALSTLAAVKQDFPLLKNNPGLHYLDSAATAQRPAVVLDAIREFYETSNANPHRGAYRLSSLATERYHDARRTIARFLGITDDACLIFTRGTTEGLNLVAASWGRANVTAGDEIVVTAMDHHANFVPWQQVAIEKGATVRVCELTSDGRMDLDCLGSMLSATTKIVAFNQVSNAIGTINPVADVVAVVRERAPNAIIVCDGAQSAPHLRVNVEQLGVDFYAFSGHKVGGPMGIGGLWGRRELLEAMPPYQTGGDMIEWVYDDRSTWNVLPHKFEAGTPNAADAVGLAAACGYLESLGMEAVREHEMHLTAIATEQLLSLGGVRVFGPRSAAERSGVVSFDVDGVHPHDLATILDDDGVCIRAGHHCCQPLMRRLGVSSTARGSFFVYSTEEDVEALVSGVKRAKRMFGV